MKIFEVVSKSAKFVPDVGTIVEYGIDYLNNQPRTYRVTSWLKKYVPPKRSDYEWLDDILDQSAREFGPDKTQLVYCNRKEAEYVGLSGIAGTIARINDVKIVGRVNWPEEQINDERKRAIKRIGQVLY